MRLPFYTHEQLVNITSFNAKDIEQINLCRRQHNCLGFGYQLAFVRLTNRFPMQQPFEIVEDILTFVSVQLSISSKVISSYCQRRQTIDEHRERIRTYLGLRRFGVDIIPVVKEFIFNEACRLEQTNALLSKTEQYLKEKKILKPSEETLRRLIASQRQEAKNFIFKKISQSLSKEFLEKLDSLIEAGDNRQSELNFLKLPPGSPSPSAMLKLSEKIERIRESGILAIDISWLNNNYQRSLTSHAKKYTATKIKRLKPDHRYALLVCFLWQTYRDTVDFMVDMYDKTRQ